MYLPNRTFAASFDTSDSEEASDDEYGYPEGYASLNIKDILSVDLPENVRIIIQTGGAGRWMNPWINPNKSQRFIYDKDGFRLLEENPIENIGDEKTLEGFLSFCNDNYTADHKMVAFWDHGGGVTGACCDNLYANDCLSLTEIRNAFSKVYEEDTADPAIDIVGFDACLMASCEVADYLDGYGKYLVASEELEPGHGWDYATWLSELAARPGMSPEELGKSITDEYIDYYANRLIQLSWCGAKDACTFSVVDIDEAAKTYDEYGKLMGVVLSDLSDDPTIITKVSRAADNSIRYADNVYKYFNTIDFGMFMDNLSQLYPNESSSVSRLLDQAVLYKRGTSYVQQSQGLSVYFPSTIESIGGLSIYLDFINETCTDENVKAVYYYKLSGCLNSELTDYVSESGYGKIENLNVDTLNKIQDAEVTFLDDGNFKIDVTKEEWKYIQDYKFYLHKDDPDNSQIVVMGEDSCLFVNDEGALESDFDGEWASIGNSKLSLEKISENDESIQYSAPVLINDEGKYLIISYDKASKEMTILGTHSMAEDSADILCRSGNSLEFGDIIQPIYEANDIDYYESHYEYGKKVIYRSSTKLTSTPLSDGDYYAVVSVIDPRGDEYNAPVVSLTIDNGKISKCSFPDDLKAITS